ncbi:2'-5' RNA ligase family protein [Algoriphagus chordae]|nr:2'-5' RNA ligase family protein [Algoriphagus chordae]
MQKYFLAIVPEGVFQERVTNLKLEIKDRYQAKYALKSPAHITVKMPFIFNEAKEDKLLEKLRSFVAGYQPMEIAIKGVKTFGERVIYLGVKADQNLFDFQNELKTYCKRELNLVDELSDRNYHPHMTIAFKDLKKSQFQNILRLAVETEIAAELQVSHIVLLKRVNGTWSSYKKLDLG